MKPLLYSTSVAMANRPPTRVKLNNSHKKGNKSSLENEKWLAKLNLLLRESTRNSELTVPWVAEKLGLSERQFSRKTILLTGLNPLVIIREARLQSAYQLLQENQVESVKKVAQILHFYDVKHFSRLFYKRFGIYPSRLLRYGPLPPEE